jgi:hypothetical protein
VRATDAAGNTDHTPATRTWTVDTTATKVLARAADTKISESAPTTKYGAVSSIEADGIEPSNRGKDIYALSKWELSVVPAGSKVTSVSVIQSVARRARA